MAVFGPLSSVFDLMSFAVLYFVLGINTPEQASIFQAFWFTFGILSQALIIFIIRAKKPFTFKNKPSTVLVAVSALAVGITLLIVNTPIAYSIELVPLAPGHLIWVLGIVALYLVSTAIVKHFVWTPLD